MADRIEWFSLTVPAGTLQTAPVTLPCTFQQGEVIEIDVYIPPGPAGNVGFYVAAGGSQYVPRTRGSFVTVDDVYLTWPMTNAINSGSWSIVAFNTDAFPHTIEIGFQINEVGPAQTASGSIVGSSSSVLASQLPSSGSSSPSSPDPLSPDSLIASLPASVTGG